MMTEALTYFHFSLNIESMIKRTLTTVIDRAWKRGKSILLLGPRQTGKTTLARQFEFDLTVQLLSSSLRRQYEMNPDLIIREVAALRLKKPARVLIDEVQKVPGLMDSIQLLIDERKAQFFITGSSARKLKQQSEVNLLPGRVISFRLDTLTFDEFSNSMEPKNIELDSLLYFGQLPEVVLTTIKNDKAELLRSYVETYLEEEIRKESGLRRLPEFYRFLESAASQAGNIVSYTGISQDIGVSHVTVKAYYEILESTLIADRIDPIVTSPTRPKLIRSPRYLFFDLGVQRVCAKEAQPLPRTTLGKYFECWAGMELLKMIRHKSDSCSLCFWQDPGAAEVDWVLKKGHSFLPIEVKLSERIKTSDVRHLKKFIEEYSCPKGGIVVFSGNRKQMISDQITAVPWFELTNVVSEMFF